MTISAFDVDSYNKPGFDFGTAYAQGYRAGYIKLGGDNLSPRYCGSGFQNQFNSFVAAGFEHRGSYWVTGGPDPVASANFYLAHRDPRTTFDVLDNETLDDGRVWSDAEACAFFDVLIAAGLKDLWQYGSRDSLWNTHGWPGLEARGIKAIVAIYNDAPFSNVYPRTYPQALVKGHQFTSSASIGGLGAIDANAFTDDAFTGGTIQKKDDNMPTYNDTQNAVLWPNGNGYYNSYEQGVYNALKYWIDNGKELAGTEGTVQREIYTVIDAVTKRDVQAQVTAIVSAVRAALPAGQGGTDADEAAIIAGVLAGLPKSYTVTPAK
jgi:hypothetical protein